MTDGIQVAKQLTQKRDIKLGYLASPSVTTVSLEVEEGVD